VSDIAVSAEGLGKRYRIIHQRDPYGRLTESLAGALRAPLNRLRGKPRETAEWFWALNDVSFELRHGDVLGVIGRNGAGKSTLLKILSRITEPTTGEARMDGVVGSLLEVGTGFHPELTGRENIYMSAALLGMRRRDIKRRFGEIAEFAGTEQFLDTPVKRYSSGMQVRLGFAVAAHLEPDILIVDEVLAVGDAAFQRKCLGKMRDAAAAGRTVIFVSHDLGAVASLTSVCIYLETGSIKESGPTPDVIRAYLSDALPLPAGAAPEVSSYRRSNAANAPARIGGIAWASPSKVPRVANTGDPVVVDINVDVLESVSELAITATIKGDDGRAIAILYSPDSGFRLTADPGTVAVRLIVADLPLAPGKYFADVGVTLGPSSPAYDVIVDFPLVEIVNSGQVVHWPGRPWGATHPIQVSWDRFA
jgi:lipopolysaccharide transport system ATP-binding protein